MKVPTKPKSAAKTESLSGGQVVLLSVTGQSPGVLTETIWALAHETPSIIPHRVVVITTTEGQKTLIKDLLSPPEDCVWDQLRQSLEAKGFDLTDRLRFGQTHHDIRVFTIFDPKTKRTRELPDITSEAQNLAAADFIMEQVRGLAMDDDVRLVASVAGGRKTMGALLFAIMSLLAKEDDLLTHVLINDPFESRGLKPRFYFPPKSPIIHHGTDREGNAVSISSEKARIQLGRIPFVALRTLFERDLKKKQSYSQLVKTCQRNVYQFTRQNVRLTISRSKTVITVNGRQVVTTAKEHLYLLFLVERAQAGAPTLQTYAAAFEDFNRFCERVYSGRREDDFSDWRYEAAPIRDSKGQLRGLSADEMERFCVKQKNRLKAKLEEAGSEAARLVGLLPKAGRFSLELPAEFIQIKE